MHNTLCRRCHKLGDVGDYNHLCKTCADIEREERRGEVIKMSYSVNSNCNTCAERKDCTDVDIIQGAVDIIHSITIEKGHKGAGSVKLECQNYNEMNNGGGD